MVALSKCILRLVHNTSTLTARSRPIARLLQVLLVQKVRAISSWSLSIVLNSAVCFFWLQTCAATACPRVHLCCLKHTVTREQLEQEGKQLGIFGVEVGQPHTEEDQICEQEHIAYFSMRERHVQRYAIGVNRIKERQEELELRPGTVKGETALVETLFDINVSDGSRVLCGLEGSRGLAVTGTGGNRGMFDVSEGSYHM